MSCPQFVPWEDEFPAVNFPSDPSGSGTFKAVLKKGLAPMWVAVGVIYVPDEKGVATAALTGNNFTLYGAVTLRKQGNTARRVSATPLNNSELGAQPIPDAWEGHTALEAIQIEGNWAAGGAGEVLQPGTMWVYAKAYPSQYMSPLDWERIKQKIQLTALIPEQASGVSA